MTHQQRGLCIFPRCHQSVITYGRTRQTRYLLEGWNVTGDTFIQDENGYFWFQARSDDMILSAGYIISGPEVEVSLAGHPAVGEGAVVGAQIRTEASS